MGLHLCYELRLPRHFSLDDVAERVVNRIVAHFAGAFHDALREHGHVAGAIFEHRQFDGLETREGPNET